MMHFTSRFVELYLCLTDYAEQASTLANLMTDDFDNAAESNSFTELRMECLNIQLQLIQK